MTELKFQPFARRPRVVRRSVNHGSSRTVLFLMLGTSGTHPAPGFQQLLWGVSAATEALGMRLVFSYVGDAAQLPSRLGERDVEGLLLHGALPDEQILARIRDFPTVWLMGNRQRPTWGDQVMPDNVAIGDLAAAHLARRGHRRMAYVGVGGWSWAFGVRALSFHHGAHERGATDVDVLNAPLQAQTGDYWGGDLEGAGDELAERLLQLPNLPTGIFVGEDRLLPVVVQALLRRGIRIGKCEPTASHRAARTPDRAVDIVSCNNESRLLVGTGAACAAIDIRIESIGRRGVEQLLWRVRHPDRPERVRLLVEPALVDLTPDEDDLVP